MRGFFFVRPLCNREGIWNRKDAKTALRLIGIFFCYGMNNITETVHEKGVQITLEKRSKICCNK